MLSMKQKVKAMGHDPDEFWDDLMAIEDKYISECFLNVAKVKTLIYPMLKAFKEKYGFDARMSSISGIDIARMDALIDVEYETAKSRGELVTIK